MSQVGMSFVGGEPLNDATLTQEEVEDFVGAMVSGNTESLISVTYQDVDGTLDFAVEPNLSNYTNDAGFITATLTQEQVEDYAGSLIENATGTHTGISITYQDATGDIDFIVDHDAANNFVANEHIDHTSVILTAGLGISGGGDISTNRSFALDPTELATATPVLADEIIFEDQTDGLPKVATGTAWNAILDHDALLNFVANEHIDWTAASAGTIHASNYVDNDTTDHTLLSNIGTNTHAAIDSHIADTTKHFTMLDEDDFASNSATQAATQQSIKAYIASSIASSVTYQGGYNAATNTPDLDTSPSGVSKGDMYTVTVAGTFFATALEVGDVLIAEQDNPTLESHWTVVNKDLDAASIKTSYESNSDTNAFTDAEQTKLAGIEELADVTDTANVTAAGALMDSELASIADVKALNQSVISGASPTFVTTNMTEGTNKNFVTDAEAVVIGNTSGTNTGDQTSIVGITGTKSQFDTAVIDGDFMYIGDAPTAHTHTESEITDLQAYLLNITGEPLSDLSDVTITSIASGELLKWNGIAWINNTLSEAGISAVGHTHATSDITSGTFEDGRIAESNVTQHQASIDHGSISGLSDDDHTQYSLISSQAGAPSTTPSRVGEINVDTTSDNAYIATGTVSSADWTLVNDDTNLTQEEVEDIAGALVATGGTKTGITVTYQDATGDMDFVVDHDAANNFVANEHVDHTAVTLTAGLGLSGGGDISANRSFALDLSELVAEAIDSSDEIPFNDVTDDGTHSITFANFEGSLNHNNLSGFVSSEHIDHTAVLLTAGEGMSGGGDISSSRSFALDLSNLTTDTTIEAGDLVAFTDITDNGNQNITFANFEAALNHDSLTGFVSNEHIDHTSITLTAGVGLSGGGDISANRTFTVDLNELTTETSIDAGDFLAMVDITDSGSGKITFANLEGSIDHTNLLNIGTNTHAEIDTHIADSTIHFTEGSIDHGSIGGLTDDDHTQYALLAGRSGGQTLEGGTAASDDLTLQSTSNATKGKVILGEGAVYVNASDELFSDAGTGLTTVFYAAGAGRAASTGADNVGIGNKALEDLTSGIRNVALGSSALANLTTGTQNFALGFNALASLTTATGNVAIGNQAAQSITGSNNIGIGQFTLGSTDGSWNVGIGVNALFTIDPGSNFNTAIGSQAGKALTTGDQNTFIGYLAGDNVTTGSTNIVIGGSVDAPSATASNQLNIGNTIYGNVSTGNVGIGATSWGSSAQKVLAIANGVAPGSSPADMVQLYAEDVSSSSELKVRDEAGNITTLSPHNFSLFEPDPKDIIPWSYYSENAIIGKKINVNMAKAIRLLEELTGEKLVYIEDIDPVDWDEQQEANKEHREKKIAEAKDNKKRIKKRIKESQDELEKEELQKGLLDIEIPKPYKKKEMPKWLKDRIINVE